MTELPLQTVTVAVGDTGLELLLPEPELLEQDYRRRLAADPQTPAPYWSRLWPSARALTHWIAQHPEWIVGKALLELAAGIGLPSLYAARLAAQVTGSDYLPEAVQLLAENASRLQLSNYTARLLDWNALPQGLQADVLLLSDVNYAPAHFPVLLRLIRDFLDAGTEVLLATPQRLMGAPFVTALAAFIQESETVWEGDAAISLYRLAAR